LRENKQKTQGKIMNNPDTRSRFTPRGARHALVALLLGIAVGPLARLTAIADEGDDVTTMRWDLIHVASFSPLTIDAGGQASAKANNGSWITLTGAGTFLVGSGGRAFVGRGGGTWQTFDVHTNLTASGTYKVTGVVSWAGVEGSPVPGTIDHIGNGTLADNRAGLLVLRIHYSDGNQGSMVVSCHLPGVGPPETPETVFEGVTATKAFVAYWNRLAPVPAVDGNRTLFHVLPHSEDDDQR